MDAAVFVSEPEPKIYGVFESGYRQSSTTAKTRITRAKTSGQPGKPSSALPFGYAKLFLIWLAPDDVGDG